MKKIFLYGAIASVLALTIIAAACGSGAQPTVETPVVGKVIKTGPAGNNLTVTLSSDTGTLKSGEQEIYLAFTDASGKPVDVGSVSFNNRMPAMGSMAEMNNAATLTTTGTPGVYRGKIDVEMAGEWQSQIAYEGPAGKGKATLSVTAR
ncbi:MAG TPA: FixH family protein [Pyrinomonadaceae bacterium]|nr:FixH family protein [Pyrinomonadaceae bacterium]